VAGVSAGRYDDGRSDVPGGLVEPVERVLVVGAGIAGLTVANALRHADVDCVVLEARERIGGRLHTVDVGGSLVDLGGSWIHSPVGNPMSAFADQVGVARRTANPLTELAGYDRAEARRLSPAEVHESLQMVYDAFPRAVDRLLVQLGPAASVAEAIDIFVAEAELPVAAAKRARQALRAVIEGESADLTERQSLRWMWNEIEYGGDFFGDVAAGGYRRLVEAMATGVDVRLGVEVSDVVVAPDGVQLLGTDGSVEDGSHVVVTVPLGVLKGGAPRFTPALPPDRVAAIQRLGFGYLEKVVLRFDEPFWRAAGLPHLMVFPTDPDLATVWVFGHDAFDAGPALVFFAFHSSAERLLDLSTDQAAQWAIDMLADALGGPCPAPSAVAVTSWGRDLYAHGAYTHIPPGASPSDADLLGDPIGGRLLFAGEHTQSARLAYADGALTSGVREAKRLLRQPDVHLG
jgi:polyamine oxidase